MNDTPGFASLHVNGSINPASTTRRTSTSRRRWRRRVGDGEWRHRRLRDRLLGRPAEVWLRAERALLKSGAEWAGAGTIVAEATDHHLKLFFADGDEPADLLEEAPAPAAGTPT